MLEVVRLALRISHNVLDKEIESLIRSARQDLMLAGVSIRKAQSNTDPLIERAIVAYCKANFGLNNKESEKFQLSYDMLKNRLTSSGEYNV